MLLDFMDGSVGKLDPNMSLDEQAALLPYDHRYEYPINQLVMSGLLGEGAFGVVFKATASNIVPNENETTVAVKMVRQNADNEEFRALITELKIMIYMGKHLNVVNLLGAITINIQKRELMLIVEYCKNGNLQNYLRKHRNIFICQLNKDTDVYNYSVTPSVDSCDVWITSSDLINWGFQVASGMQYLTKRKVLHGDLAARNILLTKMNVVKISDFGLARSLYRKVNYKKTREVSDF